jgi:transcriptional regulator with GAF, ATPase, and Fis domain
MARRAAQSPQTTVLILGETGTGKQLLARAIHEESPRSGGPFLDLNCAGLPANLLESELFGHEKGAFTGATRQKPGLLELAHRGTVFLDEIGDLELDLQVRLLKFLDRRSFRRVQGLREIQVDVRLLAATHRDLVEEVRRKRFREDLYHRLNVVGLRLPPLRERPGDIPLLAQHSLRLHGRRQGGRARAFTDEAMEILTAYRWPGNVRELEHVVERCLLLHPEAEELEPRHLPSDLMEPVNRPAIGDSDDPEISALSVSSVGGEDGATLRVELPESAVSWDALERAILEAVLRRAEGNVSLAARRLRLGRGQLRYRLRRLGIRIPSERYRARRL